MISQRDDPAIVPPVFWGVTRKWEMGAKAPISGLCDYFTRLFYVIALRNYFIQLF